MKTSFKSKFIIHYSLFVILLLASLFRLYGPNWDQGHHLHPDERFLTMVVEAINWPQSLKQYLNPQISPLNPYNANYSFFVYGTLPLKIVKAASELIKFDQSDYNNITLVGRFVSALFDLGTLVLVYKICQKIINEKAALWASFLYAISVLPIQLSHFFAVETFFVFFTTFSLYLLFCFINTQKRNLFYPILIGVFMGLALACKVTALLGLGVIILGFGIKFIKEKNWFNLTSSILLFSVFTYLFLRLADPRIFSSGNFLNPSPNPQFIKNLKELNDFNQPQSLYPPAIQWNNTKPLIFPLKNLILWGLGLPLGLVAVTSVLYQLSFSVIKIFKNFNNYLSKPTTIKKLNPAQINLFLILVFTLGIFFYQGIQFSKNMRYFYLIYPFLAIFSAQFLHKSAFWLKQKLSKANVQLLYCSIVILFLIWPLSFMAIYSKPHSRVMASEWIYENIPPGSIISCEHWDDCLPLGLEKNTPGIYQTEILPLFDQDTPEKWKNISQQLEEIDYLIISSNRIWGSIPRLPEVYPETIQYYQRLFKEEMGFKKAAEITSYPNLEFGIWNLEFNDSSADESFTVYDHPKIMIFKKLP